MRWCDDVLPEFRPRKENRKEKRMVENPKGVEIEGRVYPELTCDGYKGGRNEGSVPPRPPAPELSKSDLDKLEKEDANIPLSPELVKGINEIIEENYECVWRFDASRDIEDLYEQFQRFHYNFSRLSLKHLTKERVEFLNAVYYALQTLKDKHISYKEYKSLKNLLNELYKSSAMRYYSPEINIDSIVPFTKAGRVEEVEAMVMAQWGRK